MFNYHELNIEELAERWEQLKWEHGIENLKVTECFSTSSSKTFIVKNLSMEFDDELVCCNDSDGVIVREVGVLLMFPRECLRSIHIETHEGVNKEILKFNDGVIYIEKA